ncbi:MAG: S8 family serine peptidase [Planctomycetes bacterium]|nr:S8 family serine peptidase [Planctomycetota bacterium]
MKRARMGIVLALTTALSAAAIAQLNAQNLVAQTQSANVEFNGVTYRVEKSIVAGVVTRRYDDGQRAFTVDELRAHVAAQEPQILTAAARRVVDAARPDALLDLMIVLRSQPAGPISRALRAAAAPEIRVLTTQIRAITRRSLPVESLTPAEERAFAAAPLAPADLRARRALSEQLDDLERDVRQEAAQRIAAAVRPEQNALAAFVAAQGGRVTARVSVMNIVFIRIPASAVAQVATHELVARIDLDHAGHAELDNHRVSLGLETGFWAAGIDGGVHDVGVLDTGVEQSHPALRSHRFLSNMGTRDTSTHGTGMAGILASTDATFRGMAYGLDTIVVARAGSISTSMPGMDFIASTGEPENVNYSFGNGRANDGDYTPTDQFFDGVIDTFGFMVSKSTGNGGWGVTTITHPAPAYNLMATANIDDLNTVTRDDDRIRSSSSTGPTLGGRKKPDIASPGHNSMSTHPGGGFSNIGGTSSASPHTGGGIVLLYDMGTTEVMAGKAILLNTTNPIDNNNTATTADDVYVEGSHWNARYGWGYLNLGAAHLHGLDAFVLSIRDDPPEAAYQLFVGRMFTNERATLVWQRHVAYGGAMFPTQIEDLSDLDLYAYRAADNTLLASSVSPIDNVEQLDVDSDERVVLKVDVAGPFDPDVTSERFALATQENFATASGPAFSAGFSIPRCLAPSEQFNLKLDVTNSGDLDAHQVFVRLTGITIISGANPFDLGSLAPGATGSATWLVEAAGGAGSFPLAADVTSRSYGEDFVASEASSYSVAACSLGDMNCDGAFNGADIDPFFLALGDPAAYMAAFPNCDILQGDMNGDGLVNGGDIDPFFQCLGGGVCP